MEAAKQLQTIYLGKAASMNGNLGPAEKQVDEARTAVELQTVKFSELLRQTVYTMQHAQKLVHQMAGEHALVADGGRKAASAAMTLLDAGAPDISVPCALQDRPEKDAPETLEESPAQRPRLCSYVLTKGPRKGLMCGRSSCCLHRQQDAPEENALECTFILERGARKGKDCGRKNCHYHKQRP